ncbi:MAG: tRNA (guanosine(37)-N1)-methyltransferase TrmD [Alphaproteobacteria bacterium]|nr:tRNA (guanosine(37)-N1)-methyltransferase TrmD [Alphaproteobacteria bacterium]
MTAAAPWRATVLSLFPGLFPGPLGASVIGKALTSGTWALEAIDPRGYASDRHKTVDDVPFGGGPGMVLRCDVIDRALAAIPDLQSKEAQKDAAKVDGRRPALYLSARGVPLTQARVRALAAGPGVVLLCGRYEGIDQRAVEAWDLEEVSLGDVVLAGGEIPAMMLIEACVRLLPGVLGAEASLGEESYEQGLLEYPHYTRPAHWVDQNGQARDVPAVLLSGHHAEIAAWRQGESEATTRRRRPDLWRRYRAAKSKQGA